MVLPASSWLPMYYSFFSVNLLLIIVNLPEEVCAGSYRPANSL
jgi:hypothetical protein